MQTKKRRRLTPDQRIDEILDAAGRLILSDGMTHLSMEKIALEAGASKGLLYSYFADLSDLLCRTYERELKRLQYQHLEALETPHGFEDMVRLTASISREQQNERQRLIKRLEADEKVRAAMLDADQRTRAQVVEFLGGEITANYDIPEKVAMTAVRLALKYESESDTEQQDEIWGAMIVGAMKELETRYGKKRRPT